MRGVGVVGPRPLHWASFKGAQEVVRMLLEHSADAEAKDAVGDTALQKAAENGYDESREITARSWSQVVDFFLFTRCKAVCA